MHRRDHIHRVVGYYREFPWRSFLRYAMIVLIVALSIAVLGLALRAIDLRYDDCIVDKSYTTVNCIVDRKPVECDPNDLYEDVCTAVLPPEDRGDGCRTVVDNEACPPPEPQCQVGRRRVSTDTCMWPPPTREPGTPCESACYRAPTAGEGGHYCTSEGTCVGNPSLCAGFVNGSDVARCPSAGEMFVGSWAKPDLSRLTGGREQGEPIVMGRKQRIMSAKPVETMLNRGVCTYFTPRVLDDEVMGAAYTTTWMQEGNEGVRYRLVLDNPDGRPKSVANCTDIATEICRSRINWDDPRAKCLRVGAGCNYGGDNSGRSGRGVLPSPNGRVDLPDGGWLDSGILSADHLGVAAGYAATPPKAGALGNLVAHCYYYFACATDLPDNLPWVTSPGYENEPYAQLLTPAQRAPAYYASKHPDPAIAFDWLYSRVPVWWRNLWGPGTFPIPTRYGY